MLPLLSLAALALGPPAHASSKAHFRPGDVDVQVHTAFHGSSVGPLSLLLAFIGWNELAGGAELGVIPVGDFTLGVGAEAYYTRPWFAELLVEGVVNAAAGDTGTFDVDVWEAGVLGRGTVHLGPELVGIDSVDPYLVGLLGPTRGKFEVAWTTDAGTVRGGDTETGLRAGVGAGADLVADSGLLGALELRYTAGLRLKQVTEVSLEDADGASLTYSRTSYQSPPRGFSWVISVGYRF